MNKSDIETLEEAKQYLRERMYGDGAECPCCTQFVKIYKRSITSSMCWALAEFYAGNGQQYEHANEFFKEREGIPDSLRGDFAKFKFWMIVAPHEDKRGYYRVTDTGRAFLEEGLEVPKFFAIFNDNILKQSDEMVTIQQASENKFDLEKLLSDSAPQTSNKPI